MQIFGREVFTSAILCLFLSTLTAYAGGPASYKAALYLYFREVKAFPIIQPEEEKSGDIYIMPDLGFVARREDCIGDKARNISETHLYNWIEASSSTADASIGGTLRRVLDATIGAGIDREGSVDISFTESTVDMLTQIEVDALIASREERCWSALKRFFAPGKPYLESVPWILQDVISSKMTINVGSKSVITAEAKAALDAELAEMVADPSLKIKVLGSSANRATLVVDKVYPVAYRPAYLSLDDIDRLQALQDNGFFEWLSQAIGLRETSEEQLRQIREKFPENLLRPSERYAQMMEGRPVKFDRENEIHLAYIERADLLLAASWEVYSER